jgi:aryl-alcohol dehydrogenase-like predicted oxidoreductase
LSELVLGTAQWGSSYGVTNTAGRISDDEVAAIVAVAQDSGVFRLDTAAGYGDAQARLRPWAEMFQITTKVAGADSNSVIPNIEKCLAELGVERVDSLLIHDWDQLDATVQVAVAAQLRTAVNQGLVTRVGVSIYDERAAVSAASAFDLADVPLALIQVPANVLDRRLDSSRPLQSVVDGGTRVQVRSVFLQGLLAVQSDSVLGQHPDVRAFHQYAGDAGVSPITVALSHVRALPWADEVVVGVTSASELQVIVDAWSGAEPMLAPLTLASSDLDLIDPRRW